MLPMLGGRRWEEDEVAIETAKRRLWNVGLALLAMKWPAQHRFALSSLALKGQRLGVKESVLSDTILINSFSRCIQMSFSRSRSLAAESRS